MTPVTPVEGLSRTQSTNSQLQGQLRDRIQPATLEELFLCKGQGPEKGLWGLESSCKQECGWDQLHWKEKRQPWVGEQGCVLSGEGGWALKPATLERDD